MKNFHLMILSVCLVITTALLCAGYYLIGLFMLLILLLQAFLGLVSCILDLLDIFLSQSSKYRILEDRNAKKSHVSS